MNDLPDAGSEELLLRAAVARLRAAVVATILGLVCGTGLSLATMWLLIRGGPNVGEHLGLLGNYFPGYSVTWPGAFLGFFWAGLFGGAIGWLATWLYNLVAGISALKS